MKFVFFNPAHNGDIFIIQRIIQAICEQNKDHEFYVFSLYNYFIYSEIENCKCLSMPLNYSSEFESGTDPSSLIQDPQFIHYKESFEKNMFVLFQKQDDCIFINTWIGAWQSYNTIENVQCNIINMHRVMTQIIMDVNKHCDVSLNYNIHDYKLLIPKIPYTDITLFTEWNKQNKTTVFYYNYLGMSGQSLPFSNMDDHNKILSELAYKFPEIIFIVPKLSKHTVNNFNNVIACDTAFDCIETPSCENLSKIAHIAQMCNMSIHFDIGADFFYFNTSLFDQQQNHKLHLGINPYYYNMFKSCIENCNTSFNVKYEQCNNVSDIISSISRNIILNYLSK